MDFIRRGIAYAAILLLCNQATAQTVYYPAQASTLLKSTATDVAGLFQKAIQASAIAAQSYSAMPSTGIIFVYDSSISDNQACRIESNGTSYIKFTAAEDNGLCFGVYQYLRQLGFRFYQPGSIWEMTPALSTPYQTISTILTCNYAYKTWNISGGHSRWIMDNNNSYGWDVYFGENGHQWALYQRRNGMMGAYRFAGHRGDILSGSYYTALQNNNCYVACYNGSRQATSQSVPDINNNTATQLWGAAIEQKFTQYKNTVLGNTSLYTDLYHNFSFNNSRIGIETPDGARWGNSVDNSTCNIAGYPSESDQQFRLAAKVADKVNSVYTGKKMQCYAYSSHADVPASTISISNNIDVQVIPTAFQNESSAKGLLNRWYNRHANISEYHYLNIPQWGGETPMFSFNDMKQTLSRLKEKNSEGIVWEASPAKFASLPFLRAANDQLLGNTAADSSLDDFCENMFGASAGSIRKLINLWGDEKAITTGEFIPDNKYKLPLYLQLLSQAIQEAQNESELVKQRLDELKAYLHYMVLYYDWLFDQRSNAAKKDKAAAICIYLAKVNKLQIVNSYFLITDIVSRYPTTDNFYTQYNTISGTAYQGGNLALISNQDIANNFTADMNAVGNSIQQYDLKEAAFVRAQLLVNNLNLLRKINVKVGYTNGYNYPNRAEFYIDAPAAGNFVLEYNPKFDMPGQGSVNFTVESADDALSVIKDLTLNNGASAGSFTVYIPSAGRYKLSIVSKNRANVDIAITTNGNYFYKNTAFLGNKTENYRDDLKSLPGYFFVPAGISKVYFSINNGNPGGAGFATPSAISATFLFKDNNGNAIEPLLASNSDSALFYLPVNSGSYGTFLKVSKMEQYNLCFANISNQLWFTEKNYCNSTGFSTTIVKQNGICITRLTAITAKTGYAWTVVDGSRNLTYSNVSTVDLPAYISNNAVITLSDPDHCATAKRLRDDQQYLKDKTACAVAGADLPVGTDVTVIVMAPNPSTGIFNLLNQKSVVKADDIVISSSLGNRVASFKNSSQVNISNLAPGVYYYQAWVNGSRFNGKLVKM